MICMQVIEDVSDCVVALGMHLLAGRSTRFGDTMDMLLHLLMNSREL